MSLPLGAFVDKIISIVPNGTFEIPAEDHLSNADGYFKSAKTDMVKANDAHYDPVYFLIGRISLSTVLIQSACRNFWMAEKSFESCWKKDVKILHKEDAKRIRKDLDQFFLRHCKVLCQWRDEEKGLKV